MKLYKIILILILISVPLFSFALENDYTGAGFDPAGGSSDLLSFFIKMAIGAGVVIAVLAIIYNGINIIIAQGETAKIIMAKQRMFSIFIGLCILLGVYIIASTINPDLTIIDFKELDLTDLGDIFKPGDKKDTKTIEFQEIPLGSIIESILAANSSKRIEGADDITGELCYAYDENGDTIDRDGDGKITEEDTLRGVDMFYCLEELNNAIIKKISALNADYLCKAKNTDGPMRTILNTIKGKDVDGNYNCRCSKCAKFPEAVEGYACQPYSSSCSYEDSFGVIVIKTATFCDSHCDCCGSEYYNPDNNCQTLADLEKYDPCIKEARDKIDCARNEIKIRVDGESYDDLPPGAEAANCLFTAFWEDPTTDKQKFLTLKLAESRMKTFEQYYLDHLEDLKNAINMMRDPYGERLSMAEFQALKGRTDDKLITAIPFVGVKGNTYDPVKYCEDYNCTEFDLVNDICISGERAELTDYLYTKEGEFDPNYNIPDFKDRRICSVDPVLEKEKIVYSGDGATFYFKEGFKYEESYDKEPLRMVTDIGEMGYMESEIPLGEMVNDAKEFAKKLLEFTGLIKEEINNAKIKSLEFADLAGECDCSQCNNKPTLAGSEFYPAPDDAIPVCGRAACVFDNTCDDCSTCKNTQGKCICCEDCEVLKVIDSALYYCIYDQGIGSGDYSSYLSLRDFNNYLMFHVSGPKISCSLQPTDGSAIQYKTDYVLNHTFYVDGLCGCPNTGTYYRIVDSDGCRKILDNGPAPGVICTESEVNGVLKFGKWPAYRAQILAGNSCTCTTKAGSSVCYNPLTWEALDCTSNQLYLSDPFLAGGDCDKIANVPNWCIETLKNIPESMPFWNVASCETVGEKTLVTLEPNNTKDITICDGEESTPIITE
ncbi:MAG TPA: hypothetical protein PKI00_02030, partial [Candidatus Pacearchaeota archaeon]|nr:hypothetical protein [Candidatus Pacearchaeota archaeon]